MFDFYIRHVWPWQRLIARGLSKRCSKCIISEKESVLTDGVCAACANYTPEEQKFTRTPYNNNEGVSLLLSGGKDSCYLLYKMRYSIETAIFVRNGFESEQAFINARDICWLCGVNLVIVNCYVDHLRMEVRRAFKNMKESHGTSYEAIDFTDGAEVFRLGRTVSKALGFDKVVCGLSREQCKLHGGSSVLVDKLGTLLCPLAESNPTDELILDSLEGIGFPRRRFDPARTNHSLIPVMCAVDVMNHGYCSFEREFANRVRKGEANREKWLHTFEFLEWAVKRGWMDSKVRQGLKPLGLTLEDVTWL